MTTRPDRQDRDTDPITAPDDDPDDDGAKVPDLYDCLQRTPWQGADSEYEPEERAPSVPWAELWPGTGVPETEAPETEVPETEIPGTDWPDDAWPDHDEALLPEGLIPDPGGDPREET